MRHKQSKKYYALKEMSKLKIIDKKSEKSINSEREFLSKLRSPFIVNMYYAFQDSDNLYLVMDLMSGGDLRYHISRHKKFSEEQTRFFICSIIIALEYIHSNNVIHRDIKPENLVLDTNGYIRLTDFGVAKENMPDNSTETSGTPGYMSPEVIQALNHSFPVDFFALGVIGYEFMKGERPYNGKSRNEIKEQMLNKKIVLKYEENIEGWSKESFDFINKLLILKPENRIGYKGIDELKMHQWLRFYPWEMLFQKTLPSPFIPENKHNFDRNYCESKDEITEETRLRYEEILMDEYYSNVFKNFYFNIEDNKIKHIFQNKENKSDNCQINNNINNIRKGVLKKKKVINSINLISNNTSRNIKSKSHKKSGNILNSDKNFINPINNVPGNFSNNIIYINFNINDPKISGNIYNSYQDNVPEIGNIFKSRLKHSKNNILNNSSTNQSLFKKIDFNIKKMISPINSNKNIKKYSLNKNNLKEKIIDRENNERYKDIDKIIYKDITHGVQKSDLNNKTTSILESSFKKSKRISDIMPLEYSKISLNNNNHDFKINSSNCSKNKNKKSLLNKIGFIEMKNSLRKKGYLNLETNKTKFSNININKTHLKKLFFQYYSPNDKNNLTNNILQIPSISNDKSVKTSRELFKDKNSSIIRDLSLNKSSIIRDKKIINEKIIKKIKTKNIYINPAKLKKRQIDIKNEMSGFNHIIMPIKKNKNTSFDNYKNDILIDTLNQKKQDNVKIKKNNNYFNNNNINMKKTNVKESTKKIFNNYLTNNPNASSFKEDKVKNKTKIRGYQTHKVSNSFFDGKIKTNKELNNKIYYNKVKNTISKRENKFSIGSKNNTKIAKINNNKNFIFSYNDK